MGRVVADGGAETVREVDHVGKPDEVGHEPVVAEEGAAFGEHRLARATLAELLEDIAHLLGRHELALLHIHRAPGPGGGREEVGLPAEERGNLEEIDRRGGGRRLVGEVDVGRRWHAEAVAHRGEHGESAFEARAARASDTRAVRLVEARLEDVQKAEVAADPGDRVADPPVGLVVLEDARARDHEERSAGSCGGR